jgi:hypothetical protein
MRARLHLPHRKRYIAVLPCMGNMLGRSGECYFQGSPLEVIFLDILAQRALQ